MEITQVSDLPYSCGRSEDELWSRLSMPPDQHELGCPYCQAQRQRLAPLAKATTQWKIGNDSENETDTTLLGSIRGRVMDGIKAEIRRGTRFTLRITMLGTLRISGYVLLETLREVVDSIRGVALRTHKILPGSHPESISMSINLALEAGEDGVRLTNEIRDALRARFAQAIGISLDDIDINLEDVFHDF